MRRRATFTVYVGLPDELGASEIEIITGKLTAFLNGGGLHVLNITWSCPELGRKSTPLGHVIAFNKGDR